MVEQPAASWEVFARQLQMALGNGAVAVAERLMCSKANAEKIDCWVHFQDDAGDDYVFDAGVWYWLSPVTNGPEPFERSKLPRTLRFIEYS